MMSTDILLPSVRSACLTLPHEFRGRPNRVVRGMRLRWAKSPLGLARIAARVDFSSPRLARTCHQW
ncbi:hypothetical protein ACE6H2_002448 [Prunus campanulata]